MLIKDMYGAQINCDDVVVCDSRRWLVRQAWYKDDGSTVVLRAVDDSTYPLAMTVTSASYTHPRLRLMEPGNELRRICS